jgi:hypothetical protein
MAEYRRGYVDGAHSLDAERAAIVSRLRDLPLDGDNHENLSQIAGAIWHSDFGWTSGACEMLRDKLVEILGGSHVTEAPSDAVYEERMRQEYANGYNDGFDRGAEAVIQQVDGIVSDPHVFEDCIPEHIRILVKEFWKERES